MSSRSDPLNPTMLLDVDNCRAILGNAVPLLDVRAPVEYARGAAPSAVNLPLLDDQERDAVGKAYKKSGANAAKALGYRLVDGQTKRSRVDAWRGFLEGHPNAVICCARGGLRSQIVQQWLAEAGVEAPRLRGGFKALRRCGLQLIEGGAKRRLILVGGRTGSGKTALLGELGEHVDLEGLANHRGSAFGAFATPQPPPVSFETALAATLAKTDGAPLLALEDEGRSIGRLAVPQNLFDAMQRAPIAILEVDAARRIDNIYREYVLDAGAPNARLREALARIQRRLGGLRYQRIAAQLDAALAAGPSAEHLHKAWIGQLLHDYYDPMYDYQLAGKKTRIAMRGDAAQVAAYVESWRTMPAGAAGATSKTQWQRCTAT